MDISSLVVFSGAIIAKDMKQNYEDWTKNFSRFDRKPHYGRIASLDRMAWPVLKIEGIRWVLS